MMEYIKKYLKRKMTGQKPLQQNREGIYQAQKRIYRQAALTLLTIALTVVILFAMTSAWYTNVVQTSGLTFEAESWGFDGQITIGNQAVLASPGDSGVIALTVENEGEALSALSVNVAKNTMIEDMQKRLYFYVDTRIKKNGEVVDRVYVNRVEGYTYNIFQNSQLTLTEEISNAPQIMWEWVYDVLGYYVLAQVYTAEQEDGSTIEWIDVKEYIRPIQYDLDQATTVIDTEGENIEMKLATVDGVRTPVEFLHDLSLTDGYEGTIDPQAVPVFEEYYAVDVDEKGYGVYAYLCDYTEIMAETQFDTYLGELAYLKANGGTLTEAQEQDLQYHVTLTLSAQKEDDAVLPVSTLTSLQEAIAGGTAYAIRLDNSIVLGEGMVLEIPENRQLMLDLNGNTLTGTAGTLITAQPGSSLILTNGTLQQAENAEGSGSTCGVRSNGAQVIMSDMHVDGFDYGAYISDHVAHNQLDSQIHIIDSVITANSVGAYISANGLISEQKCRLIIERSEVYANAFGVTGAGDFSGNGKWGSDIQIIDSKIMGTKPEGAEESVLPGVGIYHPQKDSTLLVVNSEVQGSNAIALKGGSAQIVDSTIIGHAPFQTPKFEGSGFTDTGDAVYIETSYGHEIQLKISGNSVLDYLWEGDNGCRSLRVFEDTAPGVLVQIEGGTFREEQPLAYLTEGCEQQAVQEEDTVRYVVSKPEQTDEAAGEESHETAEAE